MSLSTEEITELKASVKALNIWLDGIRMYDCDTNEAHKRWSNANTEMNRVYRLAERIWTEQENGKTN